MLIWLKFDMRTILFSDYYMYFQYKMENDHKLSQICSYGIFSKRHKNEFETAMVHEPSVFEPLKFYCISSFRFASSVEERKEYQKVVHLCKTSG